MRFASGMLSDPAAYWVGCLVWLPLAIWILALVRWMIGGDVDVVFGFVGIVVACLLGFMSLSPPTPTFGYFSFPAGLGTVIMFPMVRHALNQRGLKAIDVEDLERSHQALQMMPLNYTARFDIARRLFDLGYPGHALRIAEACLAQHPKSFYPEEHRMVQRWKWMNIQAQAFAPVPCSECGTSNQAGEVFCTTCGAPFLLNRIKGKILPSRVGRKLLAAWIVMVGTIAGFPYVLTLGGIPALLGIVGLMVLAVGVLVLAFQPHSGSAAL